MPNTPSTENEPFDAGVISFAQYALWLAQHLQPDSTAFNIFAAVECDLPFDRQIVGTALDDLLVAHTALRVSLPVVRGKPRRRVREHLTLPFAAIDAESWEEARLRREIYAFAERPFDLEHGPLIRARFYSREPGFLVVFAGHHAVVDFQSLCLLSETLVRQCQARAEGRAPPIPETDDATYILWERDLLRSQRAARHLAYWITELTDLPHRLELPTDRRRVTSRGLNSGAPLRIDLGAGMLASLKDFAATEGGSLYSVLLAGVAVWLFRLGERDDFIIGTTFSQRRRVDLRQLVGPLINTVPLRLRPRSDEPFRHWHHRVMRQLRGAVSHSAAPFYWLVENFPRGLLAPGAPQSLEALTPFVFNFAAAGFGDAPGRPHFWAQCGAAAELMVTAYDMGRGLNLNFNYDAALFEASTIAALGASLTHLLAELAVSADEPVSRLPMAPRERGGQWLRGPEVELPAVTFHRLFEAQVEEHAARIAVSSGERSLSYAELNGRANAVAARLMEAGVGRETIVGLLAPRCPELLAALIGISKSGAAFLPLDANHPARRWRALLEAAGARHLIIADDIVGGDNVPAGVRQYRLSEVTGPPLAENRSPSGALSDLAYVMFTSGSTGTPKGVMVEHRGMLNHNLAKIQVTGLGADDVLMQSASPAFVISVWQLLAPLLRGARVQMVDDGLLADPPALFAEIARTGITIIQTVPSLLGLWLQQPHAHELARLRLMISTGEALTPELARRWLTRFSGVPLLNAYGPTECSDDVAHALLTVPPDPSCARIPVGEPIQNIRIAVCDPSATVQGGPPGAGRPLWPRRSGSVKPAPEPLRTGTNAELDTPERLPPSLELLPPGVPGEICVTGAGVARGYINLPPEQATSFCYEPERLYRTGDRGRRLANGTLEYLGRVDNQVKIRGHRIELGEIEGLMAEHPGVQAAAARIWVDPRGDPQLIGYIVPPSADLARAVSSYLGERLPAPMRPAQILTLAALPLNPNHKLDRRALPPPELPRAVPDPPRDERERVLVNLWQELLAIAEPGGVGIHDNFFALGGHSLMLMELHQRLEEAFGATLRVAELFESPTIAEIAARLAHAGPSAQPGGPRIERRPEDRAGAPVSSVQERFWILEQLRPQSPQLNLAAAMRLCGPLAVEQLDAAFADLFARHQALRTRFGFGSGRPYQVVEPKGLSAPVTLFDTSGIAYEEIYDRAVAAARRGFDVSRAPLVRIELYRIAPEDHLLVVVAHHLICDGWSVDILIRDSLRLYDARQRGTSAELPIVEVQLSDYARWEASRRDEDFAEDLIYWRRRLAGARALELPTAHPAANAQAQNMAVAQRRLSGERLARLRHLARVEHQSLFRVLLASLHALLARICGQLDVSIAVTAALRDRPELQQTVGFLVNTLMIRADLRDDPTFRGLLAQVDRYAIEAVEHQALPFERLLRVLQREGITEGGLSPLQTYLTFNHRGTDRYEQGELTLDFVDLPPPSPFVDLSFCADESPEHLDLRATFDADQFAADQVDQILEHWLSLLAQVTAAATIRLSEIELAPPSRAPRREGRPVAPRPTSWTDEEISGNLVARFCRVAACFPDQPAVATQGGSLTYAELAARSRHLASRLRRHGGPGERVAILFHNDALRLPIGVFGPLLAGQVFVPLDSTHPDRRLREIIESAGPVALVYDEPLAERAAGLIGAAHLEPVESVSAAPAIDLPEPGGGDLAYIMYTSGSTGRPKGVMQQHRNVLHFMRAFGDLLGGVGPGDRVSLLANAAHDAGLMDFFVALLHGATLFPMDVRRRGLAESLAWFHEAAITLVHTTPTFFRAWVSNLGDQAAPDSLRCLTFDGEPSLRRDAELFRRHFPPGCWLLNCYGSTESSISMQALVEDPSLLPARPAFSLEGPVDRTAIELQTPAGSQASLYGIGEVIVTSEFVAPGYWQDRSLTAAVFEDRADGRRRYRTGDLGRWITGGRLEVVGRRDRQVKILGQRVELSEVEARIRELTGAADTCVIQRELRAGQQRLEAYVSEPRSGLDEAALLAELRATLPPFMVPQRCKRLDKIPRTPNTKVDNQALLRLAAALDDQTIGREPVLDSVEEQLITIWQELLGIEEIGREQSFFELGGDSLRLLELHHRLLQRQWDLEVVELFRSPTIRALAERLRPGKSPSSETLVSDAQARADKRRAARRRGRQR